MIDIARIAVEARFAVSALNSLELLPDIEEAPEHVGIRELRNARRHLRNAARLADELYTQLKEREV